MAKQPLQISFSLADIRLAAHRLWQWADGERVFTFSGTLGAGKTTLIHSICDMLQVDDAVSSPTFALINEYGYKTDKGLQTILHMDWYRLRDAAEATNAGMEDALNDERAICFVEWPERAPELLESLQHIHIQLEFASEDERLLTAMQRSV